MATVVLFAAALALTKPGDLIGLALAAVGIAAQVLARRRGAAATRRVQ